MIKFDLYKKREKGEVQLNFPNVIILIILFFKIIIITTSFFKAR